MAYERTALALTHLEVDYKCNRAGAAGDPLLLLYDKHDYLAFDQDTRRSKSVM